MLILIDWRDTLRAVGTLGPVGTVRAIRTLRPVGTVRAIGTLGTLKFVLM